MLPFRIALRFLSRSKFQSVLIVLGIGVGIGTQVFVGSLIASLQASLVETTVGRSAHVTLEAEVDGEGVEYTSELRERLEGDPAIIAVAPQYVVSVLAVTGERTDPLILRLGAVAGRDAIYDLSSRVVAGSGEPGPGEILVGTDYADDAGLDVGDTLSLVPDGGDQVTISIAGVFDLGVAAINRGTGFATPDLAPGILELDEDLFDIVELQVSDVFDSEVVAAALEPHPGVRAVDWQEQNRDLLTGLQSQTVSSVMIQVFVVVAVGLGIASTLAIAAVQKTRQIGILKALGLSDARSGMVFVWQAAMLGVAGTALGLAIGWGLIAGFDLAASGSESLFPVSVDPAFAALSAGIGIGIALLSALIPYRSTTRLNPIEVIQNG